MTAIINFEAYTQRRRAGLAIPKPATLEASISAFLESREWTCKAATIGTYRAYLAAFAEWLGDQPISVQAIESYLTARRQRGLSADTLQDDYRVIKTFCRWLVSRRLLNCNPFAGDDRVRPPAKKRRRRKVYSEEDAARLLAADQVVAANKRNPKLKRQRWDPDGPHAREAIQAYALILLLIDSALRAGEICALDCGQVRAHEFIVIGKGDHEDAAFITEPTRKALLALAGERPDDASLFRDWHGGRCTTRALRGIMQRAAKRAGIVLPPRLLHAWRHFAARQWLKAGREDLVIRQLMRHAQLSTTQLYTELDADELAALHAESSPVERLLAAAKKGV